MISQDALSFHKTLLFFVHDSRVGLHTAKCFVLNRLIFMGSILLFDNAILPVTQHFRDLVGSISQPGEAALPGLQ